MTSRHHRADRTRSRRVIASALLIVAAATAGCMTKPDTSTPAHTAQDFCAPFLDYFRTGFPIDRVKLSYSGDGKPDQPLNDGIACRFAQATDPQVRASVSLRSPKPDESESGLAAYVKQMELVPLPGHEKEIWIKDMRTKQGAIQTKGTVELATRTNAWVSGMTIINETDTLEITDEQIDIAADLLIKTTEAMGQ